MNYLYINNTIYGGTNMQNPAIIMETEKPSKVRVTVVVILFISLLVAYLDRVNVSIIIVDPIFKNEMGIAGNPTAQGLLMTFFAMAYGIGQFFLGGIGDWWAHVRRLYFHSSVGQSLSPWEAAPAFSMFYMRQEYCWVLENHYTGRC